MFGVGIEFGLVAFESRMPAWTWLHPGMIPVDFALRHHWTTGHEPSLAGLILFGFFADVVSYALVLYGLMIMAWAIKRRQKSRRGGVS